VRGIVWIALDLAVEARRRTAFLWLTVPFLAWWPFQMGFIDGGAAASPLWASGFGFRHSLVMGAAWPAVAGLGMLAEIVVPRKLAGELEPLLATPVSERELVAAFAAPTFAATLVYPLIAHPLALAGYRLGAGCWPPEGGRGFLHLCLSAQVAGAWLAASGVASLFACRGTSGFMLGSLSGYGALIPADAGQAVLAFCGLSRWIGPALIVSLAAGVAALWLVARRVPREALLPCVRD